MVRAGHSPSVRLFEAASCGTPILSDNWDGLDTILAPGTEIALADTPEEVLAALHWPEGKRRSMARAARGRVLSQHTAAHRAGELESHLRGAIARRLRARRAAVPAADAQVSF
jgi:spore maturation protein CgeB